MFICYIIEKLNIMLAKLKSDWLKQSIKSTDSLLVILSQIKEKSKTGVEIRRVSLAYTLLEQCHNDLIEVYGRTPRETEEKLLERIKEVQQRYGRVEFEKQAKTVGKDLTTIKDEMEQLFLQGETVVATPEYAFITDAYVTLKKSINYLID